MSPISIWRCLPICFLFFYLPLSSGMADHGVLPVNTDLAKRPQRGASLEPARAMAVKARRRSQETVPQMMQRVGPRRPTESPKTLPQMMQRIGPLIAGENNPNKAIVVPTPGTPMAMPLSIAFSLWSPDENITRQDYIDESTFETTLVILATLENFFCSVTVPNTIPARIDEEQFCGIDLDTVNPDHYDKETDFGTTSNAFFFTVQNKANVEVSVQNSDDFVWSVWNVSYPAILSSVESTSEGAASIANATNFVEAVEDLKLVVQHALDAHIQDKLFAEHLGLQIRAFAHNNTKTLKVYPSVLGEEPKTFMAAAAFAAKNDPGTSAEKFKPDAVAEVIPKQLRVVRWLGVGLLIFTILLYIFIVYLARVRMRILHLTRVRVQQEKDDKDEEKDDQDEDGDRPLDFVSRGVFC